MGTTLESARRRAASASEALIARSGPFEAPLRRISQSIGENLFLLASALVGLLMAVGAFSIILDHVLESEWLVQVDLRVAHWVQQHHIAGLDTFFALATRLGSMVAICLILTGLGVFLWRRGRRIETIYWILTIAGSELIVTLFKHGVGRTRPTPVLDTYSFPSGHTTMSVVTYVLLGVLLLRGQTLARRTWGGFAIAFLVLLIAVSRVYLGAHWFSDVIGAITLGATILLVVVPMMLIHEKAARDRYTRHPR